VAAAAAVVGHLRFLNSALVDNDDSLIRCCIPGAAALLQPEEAANVLVPLQLLDDDDDDVVSAVYERLIGVGDLSVRAASASCCSEPQLESLRARCKLGFAAVAFEAWLISKDWMGRGWCSSCSGCVQVRFSCSL